MVKWAGRSCLDPGPQLRTAPAECRSSCLQKLVGRSFLIGATGSPLWSLHGFWLWLTLYIDVWSGWNLTVMLLYTSNLRFCQRLYCLCEEIKDFFLVFIVLIYHYLAWTDTSSHSNSYYFTNICLLQLLSASCFFCFGLKNMYDRPPAFQLNVNTSEKTKASLMEDHTINCPV